MISIFGAPGAGKSLQGQLLAQKYGWEWVSYRDLLLEMHDRDIRYALDHGMFIDDKKAVMAMGRLFEELHRREVKTWRKLGDFSGRVHSERTEVILDGFPADYRQLKWMIEKGEVKNLRGAIVLRVPRGELWRRLVERKRVDDTRAAIERRQDAYDRNITGMIRALMMNGVEVREVDGGNAPKDVLERIEDVLSDWEIIPKKQYVRIREK